MQCQECNHDLSFHERTPNGERLICKYPGCWCATPPITVVDALVALESNRSDEWVVVYFEDDGTLLSAAGVFSDEHSAGLYAEVIKNDPKNIEGDYLQNYRVLPMFRKE